jgi:hypothetical protein
VFSGRPFLLNETLQLAPLNQSKQTDIYCDSCSPWETGQRMHNRSINFAPTAPDSLNAACTAGCWLFKRYVSLGSLLWRHITMNKQ